MHNSTPDERLHTACYSNRNSRCLPSDYRIGSTFQPLNFPAIVVRNQPTGLEVAHFFFLYIVLGAPSKFSTRVMAFRLDLPKASCLTWTSYARQTTGRSLPWIFPGVISLTEPSCMYRILHFLPFVSLAKSHRCWIWS